MAPYQDEQKDVPRRTSGIFSNQIFKDGFKDVKEGIFKIPALKIKNRCNYEKLKHYLKQSSKKLNTQILGKDDLILKHRNEVVNHIRKKEIDVAKLLVVKMDKQSQLRTAMGTVTTYCDILLNRFSLLQHVKSMDDITAEAVSSLIWASQRLAVEDLRHVAEQLSNKYGRCYAQACQKKQVATINDLLVGQLAFSRTSTVMIEKILLDIAEEYKIQYNPKNKDPILLVTPVKPKVSTPDENISEDLLNLWDNKCTTDKECELLIDLPLVSQSTSPTRSAASQLNIPNAGCLHPSPGGSCLATSPGGTKIWCNFDISPIKFNAGNLLTMDPHDTTDHSSIPFSLAFGTSRNNPFLDDIQDMKDIDMPSIKITNPFRDMILEDDSKTACAYQQNLLQERVTCPYILQSRAQPRDATITDATGNESRSWKTKTVEPDLLFEMDLEDDIIIDI